ncbi:MAG: 2OG-Fe dioxygenase family protein [Pseudomonadota bacterium]
MTSTYPPLLSELQNTIDAKGFAHIADLRAHLSGTDYGENAFRAHWDILVLDENFKSYTTRHRRILRYHYTHPGKFERNEDSDYVPTVTYDVDYTQGINRLTYATPEFIDDPLTADILRTDISLIAPRLKDGGEYMIDVDLFRVSSEDGKASPTTSGRHQDGQDWLFMHFVAAENNRPVVSEIAECPDAAHPLFEKPMTGFLETLCVNDRKLWHAANAVEQLDPSKPARRDLLLVSVTRKPAAAPGSAAE